MANNCQEPDCKELGEYICTCISTKNLFCLQHLAQHTIGPGDHKINQNFVYIKDKRLLMKYCDLAIDEVKKAKNALFKKANKKIRQLLQCVNENVDKLRELEIIMNQAKELIEKCELVMENPENKIEEFVFKHANSPYNIFKDVIEKTQAIGKKFECEELIKKYKTKEETDYLYFLSNGTKGFIKVDTEGNITNTTAIIEANGTECPAYCKLPDNKYFYIADNCAYGFIIDLVSAVGLKFVTNSGKHAIGGCCYYKNTVYVFGYWTASPSEMLDLATYKWSTFTPVPSASGMTICTRFKNKIVLSSYNSPNLYLFNTETKGYSELLTNQGVAHKIHIKGNKKCYFIIGTKLYESDNELKNFQIINEAIAINYHHLRCYQIVKNNCVYFLTYNNDLYKFELESKQISLVKRIVF